MEKSRLTEQIFEFFYGNQSKIKTDMMKWMFAVKDNLMLKVSGLIETNITDRKTFGIRFLLKSWSEGKLQEDQNSFV